MQVTSGIVARTVVVSDTGLYCGARVSRQRPAGGRGRRGGRHLERRWKQLGVELVLEAEERREREDGVDVVKVPLKMRGLEQFAASGAAEQRHSARMRSRSWERTSHPAARSTAAIAPLFCATYAREGERGSSLTICRPSRVKAAQREPTDPWPSHLHATTRLYSIKCP